MVPFKVFCARVYFFIFSICVTSLSSCASEKIDNTPLSGYWLININTADVGELQTVMYFEAFGKTPTNEFSFRAYSKKNIDRQILGFWKAEAGRLFGGNLKKGSLIRIEKGVLTKDSIHGVLVTPFRNFYITGVVRNNEIEAILSNGKHIKAGSVNGRKGLPKLPLRNYRSVMDNIIATTKSKLYDPSIFYQSGWKRFEEKMRRISTHTEEDAAFVMAFFYYSHKYLPFTHYAIYRPHNGNEPKPGKRLQNVLLHHEGEKTVVMSISSFGGEAEEMDTAFMNIVENKYDTLIVDLRDNPGGSIEAGMGFIRHLISDTTYGGIFLTQKYFAIHTTPPNPHEYDNFPHFSRANFDLIIKGISEYPGICLVAYPKPPIYKGKVYILTNERTASTCEPIVYAMKRNHLATIVGERTAGAMLNGEKYDIDDGYTLIIPTATYYASDGYKIDKRGVEPNIEIKDADALNAILEHKLP